MLQLYDSKKNKIAGLTKYNYLCIEDTLSNGDSTLTFSYARNLPFYDLIQEEGYVRTKDNEYVIKERTSAQEWDTFKCVLNVEDLEGSPFDRFESIEKTINEALNLALTNSTWTVLENNLTKKRTVRSTNNSAWEIIQDIKRTYRVDFKFDAILKKIHVYEHLGEDKGTYFIEDLNLKTLDVQVNTFNFYTRLIPVGKDGMTIESINNNKKYVENYQYSDKIKTLYWSDDRYTVKESLKEDAEAKLNDLSKPKRSYNAMIANIAKFSSSHASILNYKLGDTIALISKDKKIRDTQRIVKITTFPLDHSQDSVELSNTFLSFEDIQQDFEETTEALKNIMLDNGTIDGRTIDSISVKQIKEWNGEDPNPPGEGGGGEGPGIVGNFNTLNATKINTDHIIAKLADITDANIVVGKIGRAEITDGIITNLTSKTGNIEVLTVGKLSCGEIDSILGKFEVIESKVAHIDHILAGNITAENIQAGSITAGSGIIAEGAIGDAQISSLNANKIRAGTIDTSLVNIASYNGEIQISGYQILVNDTTNALDKKNRVILGKYRKGDADKYGLLIRGADGQTVMWDETGVHNAGITDGSIDNNKISDDANINGYKLDINSVIRTINKDGTEVISGTRVQVGNKTLEVELSEQKNLITENKTELSNQRSQIIANTEAIKLKVDNQTFTQITTQITQDTINKINAAKTELKGEITDVSNSLGSLESTMNGAFKDGIIEEAEAIAIKEQINQIDKEKLDLDKQYDLIYADTDLPTSDKQALKTLKDDFNSKHLALKNEITAAIADSRITPDESKNINNRIKLYSTSLANLSVGLQKALDIIVKNKITTAKESAIAEANRKINEAKGQLQTEIKDVNNKVVELTGNIDTVIKDNFISEAEALILENDIKQLDKEKADLDKQYTTIYANTNLKNSAKTNLYNAYNDYSNKHNQLKEAIRTAISNKHITDQEKNNINALTTAYSTALALLAQRLNEAIDNIVNNKADATLLESLNKINEAKGQLQGEINDVNKKVDDLVLNMDSVIKDGIIDEAEALILENDLKQLDKEKLDLNKKFDVIYNNQDLTGSAKTNLNAAHTDFNTKHKTLVDKIREVIANKKVSDAEKIEINKITTSYSSSVAVLGQRFEEAVDAIVTKKSANTLAQAIAKINEAKEQLNNEIRGVGDSLQNLDNEIRTSFKDGIISEAECIEIKGKIQTLEIEKKDVQKQYDSIYSNSDLLGSAKTNLYNSKVDYDTKYTELINAINSSIADKLITSEENTNVNNKITAYGNSLALLSQRLNEALDFIVSKKADNALLQAIEKINQAKSELKTEIGQVDSALGNLNNEIHTSFKDGIISEAETLAIKEQIKSLDIEKEDVISKYNNLYSNSDLAGSAKTNLYNSKVDFEAKHNALKESINAAIADNKATTTEKNDIDAKTKAYSTSLATLSKRMNEAVDSIAQKKSENAILSSKEYTDGQVTIVDTKLEKATSEIKILKEEISLKVSETTVNNIKAELDNKISANSTKISENKSEIILTKESIKQQVSSLNSQITTVENNLNNTITKVNTVSNKVTTLETNLDGITAKVENVEIKVEQTGNKLDNLQTGGRNLVKNSGNFKNLDFWIGNPILENSEIKASGTLKNNSLIKLEAGREYIYSIEFKPSRNMNVTETSLLNYELVTSFMAEPKNNWNINTVNDMQSEAGWTYVHFSVDRSVSLTKCETKQASSSSWRNENLISTGSNSYKCYVYCYEGDTIYNIRLTDSQGNAKISNDFLVTTNPIKPPVDESWTINNIENSTGEVGWFYKEFTISKSITISKCETSYDNGSSWRNENAYNVTGNTYKCYVYISESPREYVIKITDDKGKSVTSNKFTVSKKETTPPPEVDNAPSIGAISNINANTNTSFSITYVAIDDNAITKHEFSDNNGSSYSAISPTQDVNSYRFTKSYSSAGIRNCRIRVTDTKNQTATSDLFTITIKEVVTPPPDINNKPIINNISVSNQNSNGTYRITYVASYIDNDTLTHKLKIDNNNYTSISPSKSGNNYTYNGTSLNAGRHICYLQVSDGKETTTSSSFIVEIPNQVVSDNIFASLELLSDKNLVANKMTRVILKLKTKADLNPNYRVNPKITETNTFNLKNMQFEEGNKVSPWKHSDEDVKKAIEDAKNSLQTEINDVNTTITDLDNEIKTSFKDNVLDLSEKQVLRENLNRITKEKLDVDAKYNVIYNNSDLVGNAKTNLYNAKSDFDTSYNTLKATIETILNKTNVTDADAQDILQKNQAYARATAELSKRLDMSIDIIASAKSNNSLAEAIKKINESKEILQGSINNVQNSVNDLSTNVETVIKDGIVDEAESIVIKNNIVALETEKVALTNQYNAIYNNANLNGNAKTNLYNAKSDFDSKSKALIDTINSAIADKKVDTLEKNSISTATTNYNNSLGIFSKRLNEAIDNIASNKSNGALAEALEQLRLAKASIDKEVNDLKLGLGDLSNTLEGSFKDGIISEVECIEIKGKIVTLEIEKKDLQKKYDSIYNNSSLSGVAKSNLYSAMNDYNTKFTTLINAINEAIKDKVITTQENTTVNTAITNYGNALALVSQRLNEAIDNISTNKSNSALSEAISKINDAKSQLQGSINNVQNSVTSLDNTMNGAFKDGVLNSSECLAIQQNITQIDKEKDDLTKKYTTLYNNSDLSGTPKTELYNAKQNYDSVHNSLKSTINSAISDKQITTTERNNISSKLSEYSTSLSTLSEKMNNAINAISTSKSNNALSQAISKINESKALLQKEIAQVSQKITDVENNLSSSLKDGIIDEAEALILENDIKQLNKEKLDLDKKYTTIYANTSLSSSAKTNLYNAKSDYDAKHKTLVDLITTVIANKKVTEQEKTQVSTATSNYSTSLATLGQRFEEAVDNIATNKSNNALAEATKRINDAKSQLQGSINSVQNSVTSLDNTMNNAFKDSVISESESLAIKEQISIIDREKADLDKKYNNLYSNSDLVGSAKSDLYNAKNIYNTNHTNLKNSINSAIADKNITTSERTDINNKLSSYSTALATLSEKMNEAINSIATKKANDALNSANSHTNGQITTVNQKISGIKIEQDKINATVSNVQTTVTQTKDKVTGLESNMTQVNSKISNIEQTNSSITSSVNELKTTTNGLTTTVNQQGSTITQLSNKVEQKVSVNQVESMIQQTESKVDFKFSHNGAVNLIRNGRPRNTLKHWEVNQNTGNTTIRQYVGGENWNEEFFNSGIWWEGNNKTGWCRLDNTTFSEDNFSFNITKKYSVKVIIYSEYAHRYISVGIMDPNNGNKVAEGPAVGFESKGYKEYTFTFQPKVSGANTRLMIFDQTNGNSNIKYFIPWVSIVEGDSPKDWCPHFAEVLEGNTIIDRSGVKVYNGGFEVYDRNKRKTIYIDNDGLIGSDRGFAAYGDAANGAIHYAVRGMWQTSDSLPLFIHTNDRFETLKKNGTSWCKLYTGEVRLSHTASHANGSKYCRLGNNYDGAEELELYDFHRGRRLNMSANRVWFTDLAVSGNKNRIVETKHHETIALSAYETTTPYFGDIGEGKIVNGECLIAIDPILVETINTEMSYQVFLQKYGKGELWVDIRTPNYFIVKGEEGLSFAWELKAKQKGYEYERLNQSEKREDAENEVLVDIDNYLNSYDTLYEIDEELKKDLLSDLFTGGF